MLSIEDRNKLVMDNYDVIEITAKNFCRNGVPYSEYEDLCQEGVIGLIDSLSRFDTDKGSEVRTFCEFRVKGAMLDYLRAMDRVPRSVRVGIRKRKEAIERYVEKYCDYPSESQIAKFLNITIEKYRKEYGNFEEHEYASLDQPINGDGTDPMIDLIPDGDRSFIEDICEKEEFEFFMKKILEINDRNREIMLLYINENHTMKEIASFFDITESRVSQIITMSTKELREIYKKEMSSKSLRK